VLYYFGTGPVQGFAVTLAIGILTTLFTVLFCGKVFLKMLLGGGVTEWKMMKLMTNPKIDFLRVAKACVVGSILGTVVVMGIFFARGEKNYGIDFKGGANVAFAMNKPQSIDSVRGAIHALKKADGTQKYADAEIQTVAEPDAKQAGNIVGGMSRTFQMRSSDDDIETIKKDIQDAFKDHLSREPFEEMTDKDVDPNPRKLDGRPEGKGWIVYVKEEKFNLADMKKRLAAHGKIKDLCEKDSQGEALFTWEEMAGAPQGLKKMKFAPTKVVSTDTDKLSRLRDEIKNVLGP